MYSEVLEKRNKKINCPIPIEELKGNFSKLDWKEATHANCIKKEFQFGGKNVFECAICGICQFGMHTIVGIKNGYLIRTFKLCDECEKECPFCIIKKMKK